MKKILLLLFILTSTIINSQIHDSTVFFVNNTATFRITYVHNVALDETEILYFKADTTIPYAKVVHNPYTNISKFYRDDTLYFKHTYEDFGDIKERNNYYLENGIWVLGWKSIEYYSIPTYNIESNQMQPQPQIILYQNNEREITIRTVDENNMLDYVIIYNGAGQILESYSNISSNIIRITVNVKGHYIIKTKIDFDDYIDDPPIIKNIIIK